MKSIIVLLITLLVTGCGKIHSYQLLKATEICGEYKNINYIHYEMGNAISIRCIDGKFERVDQ